MKNSSARSSRLMSGNSDSLSEFTNLPLRILNSSSAIDAFGRRTGFRLRLLDRRSLRLPLDEVASSEEVAFDGPPIWDLFVVDLKAADAMGGTN
ncbi:hypothetical protein QJS04_geneDACA013769 [Acorus gramineus]|uniref:Uncharacterized protein n=1 Tax=Acorus gramineus TaxID=55184 RepID=A0AAV9AUW2_ACOGR|nr:hypothetical protein QJS04_geneDACA013769 [Acorus gramineus]